MTQDCAFDMTAPENQFFQAGFNAIVRKWLESGCRETPEEISCIIKEEYEGKYY